jgi:hypothetical protein
MSVSFTANILVGVKLTDLATLRVEENEFDEFDRKGQKTGKTFKEKQFFLDFINGNIKILETEKGYRDKITPKLYSDEIDGVDGCDDNLELLNLDYYPKEFTTDNFVVCKSLYSYSDLDVGVIKLDDNVLEDMKIDVANRLKEIFDYDGEVDAFFYKNIS